MKSDKILCQSLLLVVLLHVTGAAAGADSLQGKKTYEKFCITCHGASGAGDGPAGRAFPPGIMPNLSAGTLKYAVDKEKMKELIKKGGVAVGLSPIMPQHPTLSDQELDDVSEYVRTLIK